MIAPHSSPPTPYQSLDLVLFLPITDRNTRRVYITYLRHQPNVQKLT